MKTLIFSSLVLALTLTACSKDDEIARPDQMVSTFHSDLLTTENPALNSVTNGYCKDLQTEHILLGRGVWTDEFDPVVDKYHSQYILNASGQAYLNETELGRSQLSLEYSHETKTFSGVLFTYFEEITMQHRFFGTVEETLDVTLPSSKDPVINGEAELVRGSMGTASGAFLLRDGISLKISVNPTLTGDVDVKVSIIGWYCITDNIFINRF